MGIKSIIGVACTCLAVVSFNVNSVLIGRLVATPFQVIIDIKPSKKPENVISLKKDKNLKVAIVGEEALDALQVDPATVKFGPSGASPVRSKGRDYDRDGFSDLILTFKLNETGIACSDTEATLTGETYGGGAIEGSDTFTVATAAGGAWGTAELIETENLGSQRSPSPQVAVDNSGNALAVWQQYDGTLTNIWASHFSGTSWGTPELIETENLGNVSAPQVEFDGSGNGLAVWMQDDGTHYTIWANRFNGTSWGTAELIETENLGNSFEPQVAFDGNGNALAVWRQHGTLFNIWANRFNGTSWGTAELIQTESGSSFGHQVAVDNSGNALAVWQQWDGTNYNIWANRFNGTSWGTAELIETDNLGSAYSPQVAFDGSGNGRAVWHQFDGTRANIWTNRFNGTSWGTAEQIETDVSGPQDSSTSITVGTAIYPQVAVDDSGNALVVWQQYDGIRHNVWASHFSGTSWGAAELIETENLGTAGGQQVVFDNSGNALAVWSQYDGNRANIWANRFNGTRWGNPELIETDNSGSASAPQVAFDGCGNALAVWQQYDATLTNIWANRFK